MKKFWPIKLRIYIEYLRVFELACLLHDVGHAPFSHTGEQFCLQNGDRGKLHESIIELTGDVEVWEGQMKQIGLMNVQKNREEYECNEE